MTSLVRLLAKKRVIVTLGSGGVGKTTLAAALALQAAWRGRRTLVLTIDPARRLADALGLAALTTERQRSEERRGGKECSSRWLP